MAICLAGRPSTQFYGQVGKSPAPSLPSLCERFQPLDKRGEGVVGGIGSGEKEKKSGGGGLKGLRGDRLSMDRRPILSAKRVTAPSYAAHHAWSEPPDNFSSVALRNSHADEQTYAIGATKHREARKRIRKTSEVVISDLLPRTTSHSSEKTRLDRRTEWESFLLARDVPSHASDTLKRPPPVSIPPRALVDGESSTRGTSDKKEIHNYIRLQNRKRAVKRKRSQQAELERVEKIEQSLRNLRNYRQQRSRPVSIAPGSVTDVPSVSLKEAELVLQLSSGTKENANTY
ncbi:hypothetical protein BJ742DRAFT_774736 [Cladochytrium replicatum]|nr:hypothetical protein BJ742DRAFT_774736 [Cladochytrium replicatum]